MPLYDYKCEKCDNTFTVLCGMAKRNEKKLCEKCGTANGCLQITNIANTPGKWGDTGRAGSWAT